MPAQQINSASNTLPKHVFDGYGRDWFDPNVDVGLFSRGPLVNVIDQDILNANNRYRTIQERVELHRDIVNVFSQSLDKLSNLKTPTIIQNPAEFQSAMVGQAYEDFKRAFKPLDQGKIDAFKDCLKEYGPETVSELSQKQAEAEARFKTLDGLYNKLADTFEKNSAEIMKRWPKIKTVHDIFAIGIDETDFNPRDVAQLGKKALEALQNPKTTTTELFDLDTASRVRDFKIAPQQRSIAGVPATTPMPPVEPDLSRRMSTAMMPAPALGLSPSSPAPA